MGLPYFKFYPSDFLGDASVVTMDLEERGAYITLLCLAWSEGHVPADSGERARWLGVSRRRADKLWERVGRKWISDGNGGFVNPRLEEEREKAEAKSAAARASANARYSHSERNANA